MKHHQENILKILKERGERLTPVRDALLKIFLKSRAPLSAPEIVIRLKKSGLKANKTTVYRQLEVLQSRGILELVTFEDGIIRYEISGQHHHHLVCTSCKKVEDVVAPEDLQKFEASITKRSRFKIVRHSLEFYGICKKCR